MGEPNQDPDSFRGVSEMAESRDVTSHARTLLELLKYQQNKNLTLNMLVAEWRKGPSTALQW